MNNPQPGGSSGLRNPSKRIKRPNQRYLDYTVSEKRLRKTDQSNESDSSDENEVGSILRKGIKFVNDEEYQKFMQPVTDTSESLVQDQEEGSEQEDDFDFELPNETNNGTIIVNEPDDEFIAVQNPQVPRNDENISLTVAPELKLNRKEMNPEVLKNYSAKSMNKKQLKAVLKYEFPRATFSGNRPELIVRLNMFRKNAKNIPTANFHYDISQEEEEAQRKIFDEPKEEDWVHIENLEPLELLNFSLEILLTFLNTSTLHFEGDNMECGVESQRKKGRNMYKSRLIYQAQYVKHKGVLLVRAKMGASMSDIRR